MQSGAAGSAKAAGAAQPSQSLGAEQSAGVGQSAGSGQSSAASGAGDYTVNAGDTLAGIAREHNLSYRDLARWNNIQNPDRISKGQTLRLAAP
ncbi:LysM domain-containing protein [Janthinobacterium sp. 17J80-10]|nr:LysM domain-containing protein [Janthinobacterium sp. 17J80-10]